MRPRRPRRPIGSPATGDPATNGTQASKVFDETYVRGLREEAAKHRVAASEAQKKLDAIAAAEKLATDKLALEQGRWQDVLKSKEEALASAQRDLDAAKARAAIADRYDADASAKAKALADKLGAAAPSIDGLDPRLRSHGSFF